MNVIGSMDRTLREHLELCAALQRIEEQENAALHTGGATGQFDAARKALLPRLEESLRSMKDLRCQWQALASEIRAANIDLQSLMQSAQNSILGALALQRENERVRLRRGLLPATQVPSANQERPHFVSELYRRHA